MIKQLILCVTLMAAQIAGQSVCCCHFGEEHSQTLPGDHWHDSEVGLHSHGQAESHGHYHGGDCDGHHDDSNCGCESDNLVFIADADLCRIGDEYLSGDVSFSDGFFRHLDWNGHAWLDYSGQNFRIPGGSTRAEISIWRL